MYKSNVAQPALIGLRPEFDQDDIAMIEDAPAAGASDVEVPDADGDDNDDHLARWIEEELQQEEALVNSIHHVREPDEGEGDSGQDPERHAPLAEVVEGEGSGHVRHGHRRDLEILQW